MHASFHQFPAADDRQLLKRVSAWTGHPSPADLSVPVLQQISTKEGLDFATALLYDRIVQSPRHQPIIEAIDAEENNVTPPDDFTLALVPGALYKEYRSTGADGAGVISVAGRIGYRTVVVPMGSFASLDTNAAILCEWLLQQPPNPLILLSFSKGGADIKHALRRPEAAQAFANVRGWINFGGILFGTPLVAWLARQRLRGILIKLILRWWGHRYSVLDDLAYGPGTMLDNQIAVPFPLINVIGFPQAGTLQMPLARRAYHRLEHLGPNDAGGLLLGDLYRFPGHLYPLWNVDHYMQHHCDMASLLTKLVRYINRDAAVR